MDCSVGIPDGGAFVCGIWPYEPRAHTFTEGPDFSHPSSGTSSGTGLRVSRRDVAVVTGQRLSELISCESDRTSASGTETFGRFPDSLRNGKPHNGRWPLCGLPMSGLRAADGAISIPCSADRSWSIRPSSSLRFRKRRRNRCPRRRSLKEPCTKRSRQRCRCLAGDRSPSAC